MLRKLCRRERRTYTTPLAIAIFLSRERRRRWLRYIKGVLFLLQAWLFAEREIYCSNAQALGEELLGEEAALFQGWQERGAIAQESGAALEQRFSRLISWCAKKVVR